MTDAVNTDGVVQHKLTEYLRNIESVTGKNCLAYVGPIVDKADDLIRNAVEELRDCSEQKCSGLMFILETNGGTPETAGRIVDMLRHHYPVVDFHYPASCDVGGNIAGAFR